MSTSTSLPVLTISIPAKAPEFKVPALSRITNNELQPRTKKIIDSRNQEILRDARARGSQIVFYGEVKTDCAICLQPLIGMLTMTICEHFFCKKCQQQWQEKSVNCAVCRQPLAIQPEQPEQPEQPDTDESDSYDSDGPVYDPTADDSDDELTEEEREEIARLMDVLVPLTEQELASSPFQHGAEWYDSSDDDMSSDDDDYDMSSDDDDNNMIASHENFQRAIYNSFTNIITI